MNILKSIKEFRFWRTINNSKTIGFIPTMGFLHEGHLSLTRLASKQCNIVIVSIFINQIQFSHNEDLNKYPKNLERDIFLLKKEKVDAIFIPEKNEIYPENFKTFVNIEGIEKDIIEGKSRPNHFKGVTTILTKLFNIIQPNKAYFGQKDGIQCIVVKKMVKDLNFPIDIIIGPTIREKDGLAMSSRNTYLTKEQRNIAPILFKALLSAHDIFHNKNERNPLILIEIAKKVIFSQPNIKLDYLNICDLETGQDITDKIDINGAMISGAIWNGSTRLIDNIILKENEPYKFF
jgi:pantoate--beta-alanine ligase